MQKIFFLIGWCLIAAMVPVKAQDSVLAQLNGRWIAVQLTVKIYAHPGGQLLQAYDTQDPAAMVKSGPYVWTKVWLKGLAYEADRNGAGEKGEFQLTGGQQLQVKEMLPPRVQAPPALRTYNYRISGVQLTLEFPPYIHRDNSGQFVKTTYSCTYSKID